MGSDDGSEESKKLAAELGISDHVHYAGIWITIPFLASYRARISFCRTPIRDGISSSVLEALALKVPVVASENHRRPESTITYNHEDIATWFVF